MKLIQTLSLTILLAVTSVSYAEMGSGSGMPMECKQKHEGMMNPEKMKGMMEMRQKHMQKMEQRLANIETLLKELVELEKKK